MGQLYLPELQQLPEEKKASFQRGGVVARGSGRTAGGGSGGGGSVSVSAPSASSGGGSTPSARGGGLLKRLLGINDSQPDPQVQELRNLQIQQARQSLKQDEELFPMKKKALEQQLSENLLDQSIKESQNKEQALKSYAQRATIGGLAAAQIESMPKEKREEYYNTHVDMFKNIDEKAPDKYDQKYMQNMIGTASAVGATLKTDPNLAALAFSDEDRAAMKQVFAGMQEKDELKAQSDIGKVVADKVNFQNRGMRSDSSEMKALDDKLSGLNKGDASQNENTLRSAYTNQSKDFLDIVKSREKIKAVTDDPSPAGDLALIFNFMKILDPGSTVREGEYATAEQSASLPKRVVAQYNKVVSGEKLSETQRSDFVSQSENIYSAAKRNQDQMANEYRRIAKNMGANPDNVILNFESQGAPVADKPKQDFSAVTPEQIGTKAQEISTKYGIPIEQAREEIMKQMKGAMPRQPQETK